LGVGRIVNMDGRLVPPEQAFISVFDRGFLYGDSVYEVLRTYGGAPFELDLHLDRLENSAELIGLALPWARERFGAQVRRTLEASQNPEAYLRLIVTRGAGEIGLDPALARGAAVILIAKELVTPPPSVYETGVKVALVGVRRNLREAIDPAAKTGNYLNNVLAMGEAQRQGAFEALMLDREGRVTEASSANVFAVRDGALVTPPIAVGILEGVTRKLVLALASRVGIAAREEQLRPEDLLLADEVFLTSTLRELVPVVSLLDRSGEHALGGGRPGPVSRRLLEAFRARARSGPRPPPLRGAQERG
jgi:branched-chain amino acid aminotransferase